MTTDPEIATKAPESDAQEDTPTVPTGTTETTETTEPTATASAEETAANPGVGQHCDNCVTDRPVRMSLLSSLVQQLRPYANMTPIQQAAQDPRESSGSSTT